MFGIFIDIVKAMTVDAWEGLKYRRYLRKSIRQANRIIDEHGLIGGFLRQFESVIASGLTDEDAQYLLDDFVNVVMPALTEDNRIEMDEDWETLCLYCKQYNVEWGTLWSNESEVKV